ASLDHGHGRVARDAFALEACDDLGETADRHEVDPGGVAPLARAGSRRIAREMTAPNHDLVRELAIRDREAGGGRTRKEGRDSRHDLEVDSRSRERDELLPESSEKPRVASLQADDSKPLLRRSDQELADVRPVRAAEILADVDELDATRDSLEDR